MRTATHAAAEPQERTGPMAMPSGPLADPSFTAAFARHMRWQRSVLTRLDSSSSSATPARVPRFLVLRPGDKLTVCDASGMSDVRTHCFRGAAPHTPRPDGVHWDTHMLSGYRERKLTRPIPGLGNVALSLVAAAATAMVSRRVLLLENFTAAGESFGSPLRELLVETSGWLPHLRRASLGVAPLASSSARGLKGGIPAGGTSGAGLPPSTSDGFAAHDDFSAFESLCALDLRRHPPARVWRLFSNQYFLPLLLLNPHHARQLEAMAEALDGTRGRVLLSTGSSDASGSGGGAGHRHSHAEAGTGRGGVGGGGGRGGGGHGARDGIVGRGRAARVSNASASLWTPALRAIWRPSPRLAKRLDAYVRRASLHSQRYLAMHIRVNFASQRDGPSKVAGAAACVLSRLRAHNASHLFLATMYASNRRSISASLGLHGIRVHWYGKSMEAQAESTDASDSALADMLLMGGAEEVLVTPGSTFGYVAQGLAGRRATIYGGTHTSRDLVGPAQADCSGVATPEPNFHFLRHAISRYSACRAGARDAKKRGSAMYRLSSMQHR
jgi:hypothetical protein